MARLIIVPLGEIAPDLIEAIRCRINAVWEIDIRLGRGRLLPGWSFDPRRRQFRVRSVIRLLTPVAPPGWGKILGITKVDLFVPPLDFVFGAADPLLGVAVISLCRLDPRFYGRPADSVLLRKRGAAEALHELGHLYGLGHCSRPDCVMFFANPLADTECPPEVFCPDCQQRLKKKIRPHREQAENAGDWCQP